MFKVYIRLCLHLNTYGVNGAQGGEGGGCCLGVLAEVAFEKVWK